jgi:hypothetical protein
MMQSEGQGYFETRQDVPYEKVIEVQEGQRQIGEGAMLKIKGMFVSAVGEGMADRCSSVERLALQAGGRSLS